MDIVNEIFTTEGRLNRLRYFKYYFLLLLVYKLINFVAEQIGGSLTGQAESTLIEAALGIVFLITGIGNFIGFIMLDVRRLHDLDRSGWFVLLLFVPLVNLLFVLYLWFMPGTVGYNRFGEDPLESNEQ